MRKSFLIVFLAACLLLVSCNSGKIPNRTINVSGTGTVNLRADIVTFTVNVNETSDTTAAAQQATNIKMSRVLEIVRSFGIEDDCISTAAMNFQTVYRWENGEQIRVGEQVSQTINVKMKDIESFGKLVDALGAGLSGISLYNVSFEASDYSQAATKARQLAYQNALDKAMTYAMSCGLALGRPISITDGYDNYEAARYSVSEAKTAFLSMAADVATEIPSGLLSVTVNTNVGFELLI